MLSGHGSTRWRAVRGVVYWLIAGSIPGVVAGCSGDGGPEQGGDTPTDGPWSSGVALPEEPQSSGDSEIGRNTLLNGSIMSCGIPWKLWTNEVTAPTVQQALGATGVTPEPLDGREGYNAGLPHMLTAFVAADGAEVVNYNCLWCHSGKFDGRLVVGLGNATADFTAGIGGGAASMEIPQSVFDALGLTPAESANINKVLRIGRAVGPETVMRTVGMNPAEALTGVLLAHHNQLTLAWSEEPLMPVELRDEAGQLIADARLTSDPPPWWRAKKKNALFYNGMARGDHRGTMALATAVCVDTIEEATRVDGLFRDVQAFVRTVVAPDYTRSIDQELAAEGKGIFQATCSGCHGTYADDATNDDADTYPNLLIPLDVVGTDPAVANAGVVHAPHAVDWYNGMFYGQITPAVPDNPFPGYMPPPLDGVWATAPYLHNGSVPTVELVLNSAARPRYWKRVDFNDTNFDEDALGWPYIEVSYSQAEAPAEEQKLIYDTTYFSQSNSGHTFGDALSDAERRAVIEYLKTL